MARSYADSEQLYRAVVVFTYADGRTRTKTSGPYSLRSTAKAQVTAARNRAERSHSKWRDPLHAFTADGHIEATEINWVREA